MPVMKSRDVTYSRPGYSYSYNVDGSGRDSTITAAEARIRDKLYVETTNSPKPVNYSLMNPHRFDKLLVVHNQRTVSYNLKTYGFPMRTSISYSYGETFYPTDVGGFPNPYTTGATTATNWPMTEGRALEKLLEQCRGAHANLSVDFAEGRQTVAMLRKALNLKRFVFEFARDVVKQRGYRKIRPGPSQGQRRLDYVNGKWLEVRYGWMPLVSSVYDLADALRKERVSGLTYLKGRSGRLRHDVYKDVRAGVMSSTSKKTKLEVTQSQRSEIGCYFQLQSGYSFADFTSLNPALVAWELVPFSFIADWFVGVGQCLENWENYYLYRNSFIKGYRTRSVREDRMISCSDYGSRSPSFFADGSMSSVGYHYWNQSQTSEAFLRYKQRFLLFSLPTPTGPRVKANLQPKQFMDIAALVSQYVRKFR